MERKDKKPMRPAVPGLFFAVAAACALALTLMRDTVIILYGVRTWSALRTLSMAAMGLTAALAGFALARWQRWRKSHSEGQAQADTPAAEDERLDERKRQELYGELERLGGSKWRSVDHVQRLLRQLDSMDEYQEELGPLVAQSEYLKGKPVEIVQQVEDCMYMNVKKLLNYMRILQAKDAASLGAKAQECADKNAELLDKTKDFVMAVVGYVNGDIDKGGEEKTRDYVDSYMYVVLEAIDLPDARLR